ncbi:hypothetical protein [uncultured Croceitalea sp.]|uniref:hypothetical protein n=1 Tax=uncultured Croceitalea sp. TaxID=1798908 RepID=UPI003305EFC4
MNITQIFLTQLFTAYAVWLVLSIFLIVPKLNQLSKKTLLILLVIPQMFRYIGVSVAASPVVTSKNIPIELAQHIAIGDWLTAVCAVIAFILLNTNSKLAITSVWILNIIGFADQIMTMTRATEAGLANYMDAAWYVPTVLLPIMTVSHILIFYYLIKSKK